MKAEINGIEKKKSEKNNKTKSWCFAKISKIDNPPATLTKKKRRKNINY